MTRREVYISFWDKKYLDSQFPERENTPYFQISEGKKGVVGCISRPEDFPALALKILQHLKKPTSLSHSYQIDFSEDASVRIGETERKILEEILALHNDLVTPRRALSNAS